MYIITHIFHLLPDWGHQLQHVQNMTWQELLDSYEGDILIWLLDVETQDEGGYLVPQDGSNVDLTSKVLEQVYTPNMTELPKSIIYPDYMEFKSLTVGCRLSDVDVKKRQATIMCPEKQVMVPLRMTLVADPISNDILIDCNNKCRGTVLVVDGLVVPYIEDTDHVLVKNIRHWVLSNVTQCLGSLKLPCGFTNQPVDIVNSGVLSDQRVFVDLATVPSDTDTTLLFIGGSYIRPEVISYNNQRLITDFDHIALYKHRETLAPMMFSDYNISWPDEYLMNRILELGFNQAFTLPVLHYETDYHIATILKKHHYKPYIPKRTPPLLDKYDLLCCYRRIRGCPETISCTAEGPLKWLKIAMTKPPVE